MLVKCLYLLEI